MDVAIADSPSGFKYALKQGLIMGVSGIIFGLVLYLTKQTSSGILGWLWIALMGILDFWFVKRFRDSRPGGNIAFGNAFSVGFQIILYGGIIFAVYDFVFYHYLAPQGLELMIERTRQELLSKGLPAAQADAQINVMRTMRASAVLQIGADMIASGIAGAIIALVVAAICKKEPDVVIAD